MASALIWLALLASPGLAQSAGDAYRIAAGDTLAVTVFGEPDLSPQGLKVNGKGTVSFPLLGEVEVGGLTSSQVERKLATLLADGYLKSPRVSVSISAYRQFYVRGEVKQPGGYSYQEGLTVVKAIALAGGFTERASERKISLAKESDPAHPREGVGLDEPVHPGDIISVGESFF